MTDSEPAPRPPQKSPRRWLRFSLSSLLMLTTLAAFLLAVYVRSLRISPDNVANLRQVAELDQYVWKIAASRDGRRMALIGWETPVEVRDAKSLRLLEQIGADKKIIHFAFGPGPDVYAYCENNSKVFVVDSAAKTELEIDTGKPQPRMVFQPGGHLLATGGYGGEASLWDTRDGSKVMDLPAWNTGGGLHPHFSPDGKLLAVGNRNSTTRVFDVATGSVVAELSKRMTQEIEFDPSGKRLAVSYVDGSVAIYSMPDGKRLHMVSSGAEEIYTLDWSPDGKMLAAAGQKGRIMLWRTSDMKLLRALPAPNWVIKVKFSDDGARLYTAGGEMNDQSQRKMVVWGVKPLASWSD